MFKRAHRRKKAGKPIYSKKAAKKYSKQKRNTPLTNYIVTKTNQPMPSKLRLKFNCEFIGDIALAAFNNTPNNSCGSNGNCRIVCRGNGLNLPTSFGLGTSPSADNAQLLQIDPTQTHLNLQCSGYSTLCSNTAFYSAYRVFGSSINVMVNTPTNAEPLLVTVYPFTDPAQVANNADRAADLPFSKSKMILGNLQSDGKVGNIVCSARTNMVTGIPKIMMSQVSYGANYNAQPASPWYWGINLSTFTKLITGNLIPIKIRLTYYVELFNVNETNVPIN